MHCFGRDEQVDSLWRSVDEGQNVLLLAPRRVGKTMLLNRLHETAPSHGYRAVLLDVEGLKDEKSFFRSLCNQIQDDLGLSGKIITALTHRLNRALRGDAVEVKDWRQWLIDVDWQEFANQLLAHLDEHQDGPPWLILVDELPVFLQALLNASGSDRVGQFLYWLRNVRQRRPNIRWIYTGSVGLDILARRHRVEGALNDLVSATLLAFDPGTAHRFLDHLAGKRGHTLTAAANAEIVSRLGWLSPFYLSRIMETACSLAPPGGEIDSEVAQQALDNMLDLGQRLYWAAWREHLDRNYPEPERTDLHRVLAIVARSSGPIGFGDILGRLQTAERKVSPAEARVLVDALTGDGYLLQRADNFTFRMGLLREWWLRYVSIDDIAA